jgi:PEGA domain-containing protein
MPPKKIVSIVLLLGMALPAALAQDQGRRVELEESLQSRYRLTTLGGGFMGVRGGDNAIRRAGGVVVLLRAGLFGSYDRGKLASNGIQNGKADVFSGNKDVALQPGEKFYVTSIHVGTDAVTVGLLSARMIAGGAKASQVWLTANFFFDKDTLAQGDVGKVDATLDQWLAPEGAVAPPQPSLPAASSAPASPASAASSVELKPGMARDEIVNALGSPLQDVAFGEHRWLTYPGVTLTLEQGKLTAIDRNIQALVPVRISSEPDGADVSLDGSFVGSTPAVLRLQAGTYKVSVKMAGYPEWERELKVLPAAELTLHAKLGK